MSTPYNLDGFDWFDFLAARSKMLDVFVSEGKHLDEAVDLMNLKYQQAGGIFNRDRSLPLPHKLLMAPAGAPIDIAQLQEQAASWEKVYAALLTTVTEHDVYARSTSVDTARAIVEHLASQKNDHGKLVERVFVLAGEIARHADELAGEPVNLPTAWKLLDKYVKDAMMKSRDFDEILNVLQTANMQLLEPASMVVPKSVKDVDTMRNIVNQLARHFQPSAPVNPPVSVTIDCDNMTLAQIAAALGDAMQKPHDTSVKFTSPSWTATPPLPAKTAPTHDDVGDALMRVKETFGAPRAKALIEAFAGTPRMSEIDEDRRSILIEACSLLMREVTP